MAVELAGGVGMIEVETAPAAEEHVSAQPGDRQSGKYAQPRISCSGTM